MLFAFVGIDKIPEGLERRKSVRREHLDYVKTLGDKVRFAGPMMSDDGANIAGSLIIYDVDNLQEVHDILAKDPYTDAEVYETTDIRPFQLLFNNF